jgi:hypothetical protein
MSKMLGKVRKGELPQALRNRTVRTTLRRRTRRDRVQESRSGEQHRKRDPLPNASQSEPNHQHPAFDPKLRHRTWHTLISIKSFGDGEIEVRLEVSANRRIE